MNFLAAETPLVDRIESVTDEAGNRLFRLVASITDRDDAVEKGQSAPAAFVLFGGYSVLERTGQGHAARIEQTWFVVVAARQSGGSGNRQAAELAGNLVTEVINAVMGWRPTDKHTSMELADGEEPDYDEPGLALIPIAFTTKFTVRGATP